MKLYLIRHGIAEPHSAPKPDGDRALTEEGKESMRAAAAGLQRLGVAPELVLTSPLRRARETAEIVVEGVGKVELRALEELASGADPKRVIVALRPYRDLGSIVLVGHEPDFGRIASFLLTGSPSTCPLPFKKGGVACFDCELLPGVQKCELRWFLTPKQLRLIGES